jgi:hypothetical protein
MLRKVKQLLKAERGNIMVLFAGALIVIIGFIGLSLDIGMLALQRNSLENMLQVIRNDRFTYQDKIRYSLNPGEDVFKVIEKTLADNGFDGTVTVYFYEKEPQSNYRKYDIRTVLSKEFSFNFARIFGLNTTTISVALDGGEEVGDSGNDVIWYPRSSPASYNGSYKSLEGGGYIFTPGDIPAEWLTP